MDEEKWLQPGERLDDLQRNGMKVIQDPRGFCFGVDAVLLAHFAQLRPTDQVVDLGTGSGVIPLLLAGRHPGIHVTGVELQEAMAARARRSVALNGMTHRITILHHDIRTLSICLPPASFHAVVSNPPYMPPGSLQNPKTEKALARHELKLSLKELMQQAARLLKPGGRFFLIHRPQRLADLMVLGRETNLEPKWLQMVHGHVHKPPVMVLVQLVKNGKPELKHHPPLVIYHTDGNYTSQLLECYREEPPNTGK